METMLDFSECLAYGKKHKIQKVILMKWDIQKITKIFIHFIVISYRFFLL